MGKIIKKIKLIFIPCWENKYRPKMLESKVLFYYAILLIILKISITPFFAFAPKNIFFADVVQSTLIQYTNEERESLGLSALKENPVLTEAAYLKAKDMLEKDYFAHYSPEGVSPWYWFKNVGYKYKIAGENLAIGFLDSAEVNQAWLDSPSHKANIINPSFKEMGIAVLAGNFQDQETTVVVQMFGNPQTETKTLAEMPSEKSTEQPVEQSAEKLEIDVETEISEVQGSQEEISTAVQPIIESSIKEKNIFASDVFSFFFSDYYNLVQCLIYFSLIFVILSLLVTFFFDLFIYHAGEIQYKDIVFKTFIFGTVLVALMFIDKEFLIRLIPHGFNIS